MTLRTIAKSVEKMRGTPDECALLQNFYARSDSSFQSALTPILEKMSCDLQVLSDAEGLVPGYP